MRIDIGVPNALGELSLAVGRCENKECGDNLCKDCETVHDLATQVSELSQRLVTADIDNEDADIKEERQPNSIIDLVDSQFNFDDEDDEDTDYPPCFGSYGKKTLVHDQQYDCVSCDWQTPCMNKK